MQNQKMTLVRPYHFNCASHSEKGTGSNAQIDILILIVLNTSPKFFCLHPMSHRRVMFSMKNSSAPLQYIIS